MSSSPDNQPGAPPPALIAAINRLLRPLVRLLLHYQITFPQLAAMLKSIYVDVAENEFRVPGKRQSDSRINLLTGIHRKDVKRLRSEPQETVTTPAAISIGAQLIAHWLGDEELREQNGAPKALTVKTEGDAPSEFDQLVARVVRQDIRPRVILDEWLRLGVAHLENDKVHLNTGAFTPEKGFDEKVFFFGKNLQDHIAAGTHNILGNKPSYFDRSVYYDGLSQSSIEKLTSLADELGMKALTEINKAALEFQKRDEQEQTASYRMNFGVFNYHTEQASPGDTEQSDVKGESA